MEKNTVIVIGAGPTGLSTALQLVRRGYKAIVLEKEGIVGGHGGTKEVQGYLVDDGPHKLYPQVPCAMPLIKEFVPGDELLTMSKTSSIYLNGKFIPYPFGIVDLLKNPIHS